MGHDSGPRPRGRTPPPNQFSSKINKKASGLSHGCASGPSSVTTRHHTTTQIRTLTQTAPIRRTRAENSIVPNLGRKNLPFLCLVGTPGPPYRFAMAKNRRGRHPFSNQEGRPQGTRPCGRTRPTGLNPIPLILSRLPQKR